METQPDRSTPTDALARWSARLLIAAVVLASLLAMSPSIADADLWGHVAYGRDVLQSGRLPATTTYSFTAEGYRWINHENLSEIVMAIVVDTVGPLGLVVGKFVLALLVVGLLIVVNRRAGVGWPVLSILVLVVAANLGHHWSIRPQLASFMGMTALVLILNAAFVGWRQNWHLPWPRAWYERSTPGNGPALVYSVARLRLLWLAVPLLFVWANSHGGFLAGLAILFAYLCGRTIEAVVRRGRQSAGLVRRLILMASVALLATLINPYGPRLHTWLIESIFHPRPEIDDWAGLAWTSLQGFRFLPLAVLALVAMLGDRQRRDWTETFVLAVVAWQATSHTRHIALFAILAGFWIGPRLQSVADRWAARRDLAFRTRSSSPTGARIALVATSLAVAFIGWRLVTRLVDLPVMRNQFPVAAFEFLEQNQLRGRLVVTYDWAQYAIAAMCTADDSRDEPCSTVAFDGRFDTCYPQQIIDMHFDFLYGTSPRIPRWRSPASPPIDPHRVLEFGQPQLVINRRVNELSELHMNGRQDEWVLLYQDAIAQVWGRRELYDDPASPWYVPVAARQISDATQLGSVTWPALPGRAASHVKEPATDGAVAADFHQP
jgi:hypothetical protein